MVAHQFSGRILNGCRRTTPSLAQFTNPAAYNGSEVKINAYMRESILVSVGLLVCLSPLCGGQQSASRDDLDPDRLRARLHARPSERLGAAVNVILDSGASVSIVSPQWRKRRSHLREKRGSCWDRQRFESDAPSNRWLRVQRGAPKEQLSLSAITGQKAAKLGQVSPAYAGPSLKRR